MNKLEKSCTRCKEVLAISEFHIRSDSGTLSSYCNACKKILTKESTLRWSRRNREKLAKKSREYYSRNKEKCLHAGYAYYQKNKELFRARGKAWRKANPEVVVAQGAKKREILRKATTNNPVKRKDIYERDKGICWLCKKYISFNDFQTDHVIPLSKGGLHDPANIKVSCGPCNQRKFNRIISEAASL